MKSGMDRQPNSLRKMIRRDDWMSGFYQKDWFKIENPEDVNNVPENCIVECTKDSSDFESLEKLWDLGFRMVETSVEFKTIITPKENIETNRFREVNPGDLEKVLSITRECYSRKSKFKNRFSNRRFFTEEQENLYFESAVNNYIFKENCISIVGEKEGKVDCFYIAMKTGDKINGMDVFKGILTGVKKESRGRNLHIKMQDYLAKIIGKPYVVINRTQLNNYRVINNHIKEKRELDKVEHYFYLSK